MPTDTLDTRAPDVLDVAIGAAIRLRRRQLGVSQERLAEMCGVSFQQVQKYENGANRISFSRLVQIAHALGMRIAELVGDIDGVDGLSGDEAALLGQMGGVGVPELIQDYARLPTALRHRVRELVRDMAEHCAAR